MAVGVDRDRIEYGFPCGMEGWKNRSPRTHASGLLDASGHAIAWMSAS